MRRRWFAVGLLVLATVQLAGADATTQMEFRLKHGDDPRWAAPDWDDSDWEIVGRSDGRRNPTLDIIPARAGIFWVRYRAERSTQKSWGLDVASYLWPVDEPGAPFNSVFLPGTLCYDFYWDGQLIGRSGMVGASREAEVPGPLDNLMLIPDALLGPGPHVIAMRISTYHYNFPATRFRMNPILGNYAARLNYEARQSIVPLLGAVGCLAVAAICAGLFGFVDRRRSLAICGLLSLATALFFTLIAWRWLHQDPYPWLYYRYQVMIATMTVMGILTIRLLVEQLSLPQARWWLLGSLPIVVVAWLATPYVQVRIMWLGRAMLLYALLPVGWALVKRRQGSWFALAGVLIGLGSLRQAADLRAVISPSFFLFFGVLVAMLLGVVGLQIRADRRRAREAQLKATRMEIELLKKNLQPHFLLNTLTAVSEVIEQDPKGAVKFIDDLAAEFRSLAQMSEERLVPLKRELELCRLHLRVISRRTGRDIGLAAEGVADEALVPPALFLTLIENGLIHQRVESGTAFQLKTQISGDGMRCTFVSPGQTRQIEGRPEGGTGLRYVKARLEESFPGRWTLSQGAVGGGWETVIGWGTETGAGGAA